MELLNISLIKEVFENSSMSDAFAEAIVVALYTFGSGFNLSTDIHQIRFLAQSRHEVAFRRNGEPLKRESMWYRDNQLKRLSRYFRYNSSFRRSLTSRIRQLSSRKTIANYWYANRMGNGSPSTGDGWKYRGLGILQSTGKATIKKDAQTVYDKTGYNIFNANHEIRHTYETLIYMGMANWHNSKMYECNSTNEVTNVINGGLPDREKRERLNTAIRIQELFRSRLP